MPDESADMNNAKHCWPTEWLEAAQQAGFANYKGDGKWGFISDSMRDMLAEFGTAIQSAERERCAKIADEYTDDYFHGNMAGIVADKIRAGR